MPKAHPTSLKTAGVRTLGRVCGRGDHRGRLRNTRATSRQEGPHERWGHSDHLHSQPLGESPSSRRRRAAAVAGLRSASGRELRLSPGRAGSHHVEPMVVAAAVARW